MNLIKIIISMILVSLLVGCVQKTINTNEVVDKDIEEVTKDEKIEGSIDVKIDEDVRDDNALQDNNLEELKKIIKLSDNLRIFPKSKKLEVGDKYQYMLGITNPINKELVVYTIVEFKEAKSTGLSNTIIVDDKVMEGWIDNLVLGDTVIGENEIEYIPVNIEVKDMIAEDKKTVSGNYVFSVVTYDNSTRDRTHESEYLELYRVDLSIIVS